MKKSKVHRREVSADEYGVFSTGNFNRGDTIHILHGLISLQPSRESVEIYMVTEGDQVQIGHILDPLFKYCNHSFSPNCVIDKSKQTVVALRDIEAGEELTFNYLTNESQISNPFKDKETGLDVKK